MATGTRRQYTAQTKLDAVGQIIQAGLKPALVARNYDMPIQTLENWVRSARKQISTAGTTVTSTRSPRAVVTDTDAIISKLKADCARLTMERDILKKAAAYFARDSL
jgi:transposase